MSRVLISVCKGNSCTGRESDSLYTDFKRTVSDLGLERTCAIKRGGCYGLCKEGPNVIVREGNAARAIEDDLFGSDCDYRGVPGEYHYSRVTDAKILRIVGEHVGQGKPVTELLADELPSP